MHIRFYLYVHTTFQNEFQIKYLTFLCVFDFTTNDIRTREHGISIYQEMTIQFKGDCLDK